jgi:single-strand DNA-binding protein
VLGLNPGIAQALGLAERTLQHALALFVERQRVLARPIALRMADQQLATHRLIADPKAFEHPRPATLLFSDHPEQQMLGTDEPVAQSSRGFARRNDDLPRTIREQLKHPARIACAPARHLQPPALRTIAPHAGPRRVAFAQFRRPARPVASRSPAPFPSPIARFRSPAQVGVSGYVNHRIPTRREPKMSASAPAVNSVTLVGNLTADPVLKQLDDDRKVCNLRVAVNDQKNQPPMFIDVATFGAQADACAKYLAKGRAVAVTGRLVYREWEADDGTRRSKHHIVGRVQFGGKPDDAATETADTAEEVAAF